MSPRAKAPRAYAGDIAAAASKKLSAQTCPAAGAVKAVVRTVVGQPLSAPVKRATRRSPSRSDDQCKSPRPIAPFSAHGTESTHTAYACAPTAVSKTASVGASGGGVLVSDAVCVRPIAASARSPRRSVAGAWFTSVKSVLEGAGKEAQCSEHGDVRDAQAVAVEQFPEQGLAAAQPDAAASVVGADEAGTFADDAEASAEALAPGPPHLPQATDKRAEWMAQDEVDNHDLALHPPDVPNEPNCDLGLNTSSGAEDAGAAPAEDGAATHDVLGSTAGFTAQDNKFRGSECVGGEFGAPLLVATAHLTGKTQNQGGEEPGAQETCEGRWALEQTAEDKVPIGALSYPPLCLKQEQSGVEYGAAGDNADLMGQEADEQDAPTSASPLEDDASDLCAADVTGVLPNVCRREWRGVRTGLVACLFVHVCVQRLAHTWKGHAYE